MNIFNQSESINSWSWSNYSPSNSPSGSAPPIKSHSDEESIQLASSHPKKRAGRRVFKETRHPVYRGVRSRNGDKWVCELREPNKKTRIWLGTYPTPEMAARAHDVAALALRGRSACLNFADSAWKLPVPSSLEAKDIRRAATEAAELFRPQDLIGVGTGGHDHGATTSEDMSCSSFDMEGFLADMAKRPMLSPPHTPQHYVDGGGCLNYDDMDTDADDVPLWSYSF